MANKVKMKCATCHKPFKTSRSNQLVCDDCERKRRLEKAGSVAATPAKGGPVLVKTALARPPSTATPVPPAARPAWLEQSVERDPALDAVEPAKTLPPPRERPPVVHRPPAPPSAAIVRTSPPPKAAPEAPVKKPVRPPAAPKPPKVKKEPPAPYVPTPEIIAKVEERYIQLAVPEFNGIRSQIAQEFQIPKHVVKKIVQDLRGRDHLPSWWDMQAYAGSPEDLERIKAAYVPHLPVPPVGVHRAIAMELGLSPSSVYRGIRTVRQAMNLPIFNPAETHPELEAKAPTAKKSVEPQIIEAAEATHVMVDA